MTDPNDPQPISARSRREAARQERKLTRSAARLAAVQALYQMEMTGANWHDVRREFEEHRLGQEIDGTLYRDADLSLFRRILEGVIADQSHIDRHTDQALVERWPLGKIDPTLRAIFRAGGYELLCSDATPWKVAINEYVDVAKAFFPDPKIGRFVNAVLDHMAEQRKNASDDAGDLSDED
ncbi:MAG: transcription antitermination factor NusB [Neomegalonema sp.]|nr:transcription antitermination factor NusB [Neomegalonema sp.]